MSLYNSFDRDTYLGEVNTPRDTQLGILTTAQQQAKLIQNIFGSVAGAVLPPGVGFGGTVTQLTSKSTNVTLNTVTGQIVMNNASLAAGTQVQFNLNDSTILASDVIQLDVAGGSAANLAGYTAAATVTGPGVANISVRNNTAGALTDALVLMFAVLRYPLT